MSSSCFYSYSPVVGYVSLASQDFAADLNTLLEYFQKIPIETEILAEEISPNQSTRPQWEEVLSLIERGTLTTLVVPSLFHLVGNDKARLSQLLGFLKTNDVRLKTLKEKIDSQCDSRAEILSHLQSPMSCDTDEVSANQGGAI